MNSEFYVGYVPKAPRGIARAVRIVVFATFVLVAALACALVLAQHEFPKATFEYGQPRLFDGVIRERPLPSIELSSGAWALLVAPGKHGANWLVAGLDGKQVDLMGNRIEREGDLALEIVPESIRVTGSSTASAHQLVKEGAATLRGEIVDSKCFLGVMNPGEGKVHRDCAARCISGGIPPAFVVADREGHRRTLLLTAPGGLDRRALLPFVAEPIVLSGNIYRVGHTLRFEMDPASLRRAE